MTAVLEAPPLPSVALPAPKEETTQVPVPNHRPDQTQSDDYLGAASWGIATAVVTAFISAALLPIQALPVAFLLGAGLGVLGRLDRIGRVDDLFAAIFGGAAVVLLAASQASQGGPVLLWAVASAAAVSLIARLMAGTGYVSGNCVRAAPIPAALLASVSPVAVVLWLALTALFAVVLTVITPGKRSAEDTLAGSMTAAALVSLVISGVLAVPSA